MGSKRSDIVKSCKIFDFIDTYIIIVLFVQTFVIVGHVIPNNDMSPTLNKGIVLL